MPSLALGRLSPDDRRALRERLHTRQNGKCFITGQSIDLARDELEIDHVIPSRDKGPDDESNWALVFARANESKQAAHLYVARVLHRLEEIRKKANDPRGANLGHVLASYGGAKYSLRPQIKTDAISYSFSDLGNYEAAQAPI